MRSRIREVGDRFGWTLRVILLLAILAALAINAAAHLLVPLLFWLGDIDH
ncbi:hypothetical protein [Streptomyces sp. SAI-170]